MSCLVSGMVERIREEFVHSILFWIPNGILEWHIFQDWFYIYRYKDSDDWFWIVFSGQNFLYSNRI